ncbi:MAG: T9SS type A sorting domain-containing protein [Saprospiraceae bacterium]|nr:T9SS type A sorting domain-containing protein [Saprospiraceae bacterium]
MSRLLIISLILSGFLAQNRNIDWKLFHHDGSESRPSLSNRDNYIFKPQVNDSIDFVVGIPNDTIYVRSFLETIDEPVSAKYLLKTSRWGDTLAAFQNSYRAILPVPYELFMPLETTPETPFPYPNATPFNDSIYPFKIVPTKNDQPLLGVTTFDLALISRHVLGVQTFTSPYKLIAADVNRDGSVDGADMLFIRRLILHIDTVFRRSPHWVFIPKTYVMPQVLPPIDSIPQAYYFNAYTTTLPNPFEFTTIKIGDVNNSFRDTTRISNRSTKSDLVLLVKNEYLEKDKTYEIDLKTTKKEKFIAIQGTWLLSTEGVSNDDKNTIVNLESDVLTNFGEQNQFVQNSKLSFSWNDQADKAFYPNETVFRLKIKPNKDVWLVDILKINDDLTENLVYTEGGEVRKMVLEFENKSNDIHAFQNEPNPFLESTDIKIAVNAPELSTKWSIFDENGRIVCQRSQLFKQGNHLLRLEANVLGLKKAGIYFFTIESKFSKQTIKLLKI